MPLHHVYWFLLLAADERTGVRRNEIIASLRKLEATLREQERRSTPATLITLSMQVFQKTLQHINFLQPESIVVPIIIALIILIVCALIAVNMILLLCAQHG